MHVMYIIHQHSKDILAAYEYRGEKGRKYAGVT